MLLDDEEPQHKVKKIKDLSPFSIEELDEYIEDLKQEIKRAEDEKNKKQSHLSAADNFFNAPKEG